MMMIFAYIYFPIFIYLFAYIYFISLQRTPSFSKFLSDPIVCSNDVKWTNVFFPY